MFLWNGATVPLKLTISGDGFLSRKVLWDLYQCSIFQVFTMATEGKLELTIKINEFPTDVTTAESGWKSFDLDCDGRIFSVSFRPKVFKQGD